MSSHKKLLDIAEEQPQQQSLKRKKFVPQKINFEDYEDYFEDRQPATKLRKIQGIKSAANSTSKRVFKPFRITINPAEWEEDSFPFGKSKNKSKNIPKKELFKKHIVPTRTTIKESEPSNSKEPFLDNSVPLIDIKVAEKELFKKSYLFKKPVEENIALKKRFKFAQPAQAIKVPKLKTMVPKPTGAKKKQNTSFGSTVLNSEPRNVTLKNKSMLLFSSSKTSSVNCYSEENLQFLSPTEREFVEIEKQYNTENNGNGDISHNRFKSPYCSLRSSNQISIILQKQRQEFENMEQKFKQFNEEFKIFAEENARNIKKIINILENDNKENFIENKELYNLSSQTSRSFSPLMPVSENLRVSTLKKNCKKSVAFVSPLECKETDIYSSNDKGLEKAVNFYNSMRKDYKTLLSTPKLDRAGLGTPKSLRRGQDSVSRRVQKQCLMLLDTPKNKNSLI